MKIGITGASGFVGNALWSWFSQRGWDAVRLVRQPILRSRDRQFDLNRPDTMPDSVRELDLVIHCAGIVGASASRSENEFFQVNGNGVRTLYQSCFEAGVKRVLLFSSAAVYAPSKALLTEASETTPIDAYGRSKLLAEHIAEEFSSKVDSVVLRLFFPYGPGQRQERLVPRLVKMIQDRMPIKVAEGVGPCLSLIHIEDLTRFAEQMVRTWQPAVVNVGGKQSLTVRTLAEKLGSLLGLTVEFESTESEATNFIADVSKAESLFGTVQEMDIEAGLRTLVD